MELKGADEEGYKAAVELFARSVQNAVGKNHHTSAAYSNYQRAEDGRHGTATVTFSVAGETAEEARHHLKAHYLTIPGNIKRDISYISSTHRPGKIVDMPGHVV